MRSFLLAYSLGRFARSTRGRGKGGGEPPDLCPRGRTYVFAPPFRLPIKLHSSSAGVADVAKAAGPRGHYATRHCIVT